MSSFPVAYVNDFGRFWGVFWIDMGNKGTIEASFRDVAHALKFKVESSCSETVKGYLSRCNDDWLLILDNADDPDLNIT